MPSTTLNGRYRLDELIGEGGMAVVYRGYDLVLGRSVAVKLLRDQFGSDENFLRRFDREAQAAARLSHPHIANVYDVGVDGDAHYIVMEYVDGPNLKELIRRQGPFTVEGAAFVLRQVAAALDFAHSRGLVHRDIKPQNILVDANGNAKVVDFGIAKGLSDANLTEAGTGMGTVHYVSPEQARGERATPASDIYATGIVLYEMLTKHVPFDADTPVGVAMQQVTADPPPPREFNPSIPPEVEAIVMQALAKDPADRFATAGALADALDHWDEAPAASQATRVMTRAASGAAVARPPRPRSAATNGRGGRGAPPPVREQTFRDDIGCVTWLIGSAILIGLIGLIVLGFKLGDFSFLDPSPTSVPPTQVAVVATATPTTQQSPTPTTQTAATPTPSPTVTPTSAATPIASPMPTATVTPTPTPETVAVPSLIGSTLDQAKTAVLPGQFKLNAEEVFSNTFARGLIVEQDPKPEERLQKGGTINVRVSKGPQFVTIPNVQGQPASQAKGLLEAKGLDVTIVEEASKSVAEGNVIRTEPATQVANGGSVKLVVSVGDKIQVPNVYRAPYQQAAFQLEQAGLTVGKPQPQSCAYIRSQAPDFNCTTFPDGGVVSGTLQWDSWVPRGSSIEIGYFDAKAK